MVSKLRYFLLQVRNADDPMREHEVDCFARALRCSPQQIDVFDLLSGCPTPRELDREDIVVLGGSGDYSVSEGGAWLGPVLEAMQELFDMNKPTFASCWGFQAMARALGGHVVADPSRAEVGTHDVSLTDAGRRDPVFGPLAEAGPVFPAQMGHQDTVDRLPDGAVLLAATSLSNQAFFFPGKPIYCTQFHPELNRETLLERLRRYPKYIEKITGIHYDDFIEEYVSESPQTDQLLVRFVEQVI